MPRRLKIIVHGLGKVGRKVRDLAAADAEVEVVATIDAAAPDATARDLTAAILDGADVVVDFTRGDAVLPLVETVARAGGNVRVVSGTSGWQNDEARVREVVARSGLYFLYGANFSLGTALFARAVAFAADIFGRAGAFDVALRDVHHRHKADMPSGTALHLARAILAHFPEKKEVVTGHAAGPLGREQLHVTCLRVGENLGFHEVVFDASAEVITISHQTRDRGAYAAGALRAAKWLARRAEPGFYTFDQLVEEMLYGKD